MCAIAAIVILTEPGKKSVANRVPFPMDREALLSDKRVTGTRINVTVWGRKDLALEPMLTDTAYGGKPKPLRLGFLQRFEP